MLEKYHKLSRSQKQLTDELPCRVQTIWEELPLEHQQALDCRAHVMTVAATGGHFEHQLQ